MTSIKAQDTGIIYELPFDIAIEIMGELYHEPDENDRLDAVDAVFDNTDEIIWIAKLYTVMDEINSALCTASDETAEEVQELYHWSDWEDVQRSQCGVLGIDYDAITDEIDIEDYATA